MLKWSDEEDDLGRDSLLTEAQRIAREDDKAPATPSVQQSAPVLADAPAAAAVSDGDEDWMKLDDAAKGPDGKTPKKKGNKKKR